MSNKLSDLRWEEYHIFDIKILTNWYRLMLNDGLTVSIRSNAGKSTGLALLVDENIRILASKHPPMLSRDIRCIVDSEGKVCYRSSDYGQKLRRKVGTYPVRCSTHSMTT